MLTIQDLFNNDYYLSKNADVAAAVKSGQIASGFAHFNSFGKFENRETSIFFNSSFYLEKNQDVANAVNNKQTTAIDHFLAYGQLEDRNSTEFFNSGSYRRKNKDVDDAIKATSGGGQLSALEHFVKYGQFEKRDPDDFFSTKFYLSKNSDVATAVNAGQMTAFGHFVNYGQYEQRQNSIFFDAGFYLSKNTDVATAVQGGSISAIGHFLRYGQFEKRDSISQFNTAFYLEKNPDVNTAVNNSNGTLTAIGHFAAFGEFEKRNPFLDFDTPFYQTNTPGVTDALNNGTVVSVFEHYILFGMAQGVPTTNVPLQDRLSSAVSLGTLNNNASFTRTGENVDSTTNIGDIFSFSLNEIAPFVDISLTNLSGDVDLELIQDINNNGIIDNSDILTVSSKFFVPPGTGETPIGGEDPSLYITENITQNNLGPGNYFARVLRYLDQPLVFNPYTGAPIADTNGNSTYNPPGTANYNLTISRVVSVPPSAPLN